MKQSMLYTSNKTTSDAHTARLKAVSLGEFRQALNGYKHKITSRKNGTAIEIYNREHALIAVMRLPSISASGLSSNIEYLLPLQSATAARSAPTTSFLWFVQYFAKQSASRALKAAIATAYQLRRSVKPTNHVQRGVTPASKTPIWTTMRLTTH